MKYRVDASAASFLGLCLERGCEGSVRLLASSREEAIAKLAEHELRVHPTSKAIRAVRSRRSRKSQPSVARSSRGVVA